MRGSIKASRCGGGETYKMYDEVKHFTCKVVNFAHTTCIGVLYLPSSLKVWMGEGCHRQLTVAVVFKGHILIR